MILSFFLGFWLGMALEYLYQSRIPEQKHIREAEEVAATAWDNQGT